MSTTRSGTRTGRPMGSLKAKPVVDAKAARAIVRECWDRAGDAVVDGHEAIESLVLAYEAGEIGGRGDVLEPAIRLLRDALLVDMVNPANCKGELPKALGFVRSANRSSRDMAITLAFDRIREHAVVEVQGSPFGLSVNECAELVAKAFVAEGIERSLTADAVKKVVQRTAEK